MFFLLLITMSESYSQEEPNFSVLAPVEYQEQLSSERVQLVDVRTAEEFEAGHLKNARNIDFYSKDFLDQMAKLDRKLPLLIYCRSGNRSGKAAAKLQGLGFGRIIDLKGGYQAWQEFQTEK